ncbi:allophanate hydrolase [Candidatus Methylomirabilis limnetica]|uniref:Allophanate hydrolase n=1 Tax=Candidatus Methylomirabilis limnetica TaxID=2033718 RepID=A0A2T4TZT1_9BACT|nr:5-oxoprolinase subunit PxpB [Candidatus Methylomirabilis limnetica]PTL36609.1 allophanate hydrolase [Candidatus Methylomirabilis limnetica]
MSVRFLDGGESCLVVELGDAIDLALNRQVRALSLALEQARVKGVLEAVPTYRSLAIYYDPLTIDRDALREQVGTLYDSLEDLGDQTPRVVEIPTVYGGEYGPDLEFVARHSGLSWDEVVRLHSKPLYHVYMLGFIAGFPYLGDLSERLAIPRLSTPRLKVPTGSVGIGGRQTGVYPIESPGGWRIIGRTPLRLFDPSAEAPTAILPGDKVRFVRIEPHEYERGQSGRL